MTGTRRFQPASAFLFVLSALLAVFVSACSVDAFDRAEGEDFFFLSRAGGRMPVWVKGNGASDAIILFLHGGPGNTSTKFMGLSSFKALEEECRVVYWDQRCSWFTLGDYDDSLVSPDAAADDLDELVDLLGQKYGQKKIILLGVSWGGLLGTLYLGDAERRAKISGWIEVDGAHDYPQGIRLSMEFARAHAQTHLSAEDPERRYWEKALSFYETNPDPELWTGGLGGQVFMNASYVDAAHGYFPEIAPLGAEPLSDPDLDFVSLFRYPSQFRWYESSPIWKRDVSAALARIDIPSAVLWGRLDGILPVVMAEEAYAALGSAPGYKRLVIFEESAHVPMASEPEAFAQAVLDIVARMRSGTTLAD